MNSDLLTRLRTIVDAIEQVLISAKDLLYNATRVAYHIGEVLDGFISWLETLDDVKSAVNPHRPPKKDGDPGNLPF